ncbi:unnamed protein product [Laminaria digitata]
MKTTSSSPGGVDSGGRMATIHEIGAIQPSGYLFVVEENEAMASGIRILGVSENVVSAPWLSARCITDVVGNDLGKVFSGNSIQVIQSLVERHKSVVEPQVDCLAPHANRNFAEIFPYQNVYAEMQLTGPGVAKGGADTDTSTDSGTGTDTGTGIGTSKATPSGGVMTCTLAASNPGVLLLELEEKNGPNSARVSPTSGLLQVAQVLSVVPVGAPPTVATGALCDALMDCMGAYDRVMVYRFAPDNSGEVVYESVRDSSKIKSSYLNFRFPARDIPPRARELFKRNGVRYIADSHAPGVRIVGDYAEGNTIDLSMSALRATVGCHLMYLKNMGVKASLVVAIIVEDHLWGLFSFHSYRAIVAPTCEERILVEMVATITASTITHFKREEAARNMLSLAQSLDKLSKSQNLHEFLVSEHDALRGIVDVDSIALFEQFGHVAVYGNENISLSVTDAMELCGKNGSGEIISFAEFEGKGVAFFLVHSTLVAFLRGSIAHDVRWSGDPDPPLINENELHPRASFEEYIEEGNTEFKVWSKATIDLLCSIRHRVSEHVHTELTAASSLVQSQPAEDLQEFFAHVSHELRTPFHGVMGSLEVLEAGESVLESTDRLDVIRSALRCGASMLGTLNDVLDIAQNRHVREVACVSFVASSPVKLTASAMKQFAANKSIEILADVGPPRGLDVRGDESRIKHIVQNLVNNSVKFTPYGGKVWVSLVAVDSLQDAMAWWRRESARFDARVWTGDPATEDTDKKKRWYIYRVEDNGIGVIAGDLPRIMMAYRQISHGVSKWYKGTGLGLHICNLHVRAMSGAMGIASTFDANGKTGGTLFACVLPLELAETGVVPGEASEPPPKAPERMILSRGAVGSRELTFVVVDDNKVNIRLTQRKIYLAYGETEVTVLSAGDGIEALDLLKSIRKEDNSAILAGIFMDFHMPNLDGIGCTRMIREHEAENGLTRVPIFGCTADATDEALRLFQEAGADDVISKPWGAGVLESTCQDMLARACAVEKRT